MQTPRWVLGGLVLTVALGSGTAGCRRSAAPVGEDVAAERARALAALDNDDLAGARQRFAAVEAALPEEPLGPAGLTVIALRENRVEEALAAAERALALAPGRADLELLVAAALLRQGDRERAVVLLTGSLERLADDPRRLAEVVELSEELGGEEGEQLARAALGRLVALRPENLWVVLEAATRALAGGDRAAASGGFQRLAELVSVWPGLGAPEGTTEDLATVQAVLTTPDVGAAAPLAAANAPARRLLNRLRATEAYRAGVRELGIGVVGLAVERFLAEPAAAELGPPQPLAWAVTRLAGAPVRALAAGDLDGDERVELLALGDDGSLAILAGGALPAPPAVPGGARLALVDLDDDRLLDLLVAGNGVVYLRGDGRGGLKRDDARLGTAAVVAGPLVLAAFDADLEGDLDLLVVPHGSPPAVFGNDLVSALAPAPTVGLDAVPAAGVPAAGAPAAGAPAAGAPAAAWLDVWTSDLDGDGDGDPLLVAADRLVRLDNHLQGNWRVTPLWPQAAVAAGGALGAVTSGDLDGDGRPEVILARADAVVALGAGGDRPPRDLGLGGGPWSAVAVADLDLDGRPDVVAAGEPGVVVGQQQADGSFERQAVAGAAPARALAVADLDGDGDLDLATAGAAGVERLELAGPPRGGYLRVRLRALAEGSGKNNALGLGARLELWTGSARQVREVTTAVTTFGLGARRRADALRVAWPNGVVQARLDVAADQTLVEEQVLKGSCPFLYAWDGEGFAFVTDLLWNAPLGLPVAPGVWAKPDPSELVAVPGAVPQGGVYELRVTEELWEAAYFDAVELVVVDHPVSVEVASSLKVVPGEANPDRVLASATLRALAAALDGQGRDVTAAVAARDEVYADGYVRGRFQGASPEWTFTLDLGAAPAAPVRLHLDGWIFPADASLNLALAQRADLPYLPPRLEVETADGWRPLVPAMGFPAGKTKTMVVDTPPLPPGSQRLRIVTSLWLGWDRIAWTTAPADNVPVERARLPAATASLAHRGFSRTERAAPNAPHRQVYAAVSRRSPWLPFPGRYTRYGDVGPLLVRADDELVILAPGDELTLRFDATHLEPPSAGWRRTVFLASTGYDKDADRNTFAAAQLEPLPFLAMSGYPWGAQERYPDTPALRRYRDTWLTRVVEPAR